MAGVRKRVCDHAQTDAQYLMRRWARGIDRSREELARQAGRVGKVLEAAGRHRSRAEARWLCLDRPDAGAASSKWLCIGTPAQDDSSQIVVLRGECWRVSLGECDGFVEPAAEGPSSELILDWRTLRRYRPTRIRGACYESGS